MADRSVIASLQAQMDSIVKGDNEIRVQSKSIERDKTRQDCDCLTDSEAAFKKIVALVNVSDRSERSLRERLAQAGFSESAIEPAIERAKDYAFIDDIRFAEILIRSRVSQGKGSAGIARELSEHGIDVDTVPGWPYEYPFEHDEELARAIDVLERKPPRSKNLRDGAYRRLVQRGYPSSIASSAARIWSEGAVRS